MQLWAIKSFNLLINGINIIEINMTHTEIILSEAKKTKL